jgi:RNA polymerase sigma-70 factor (ECF subfamily)
VNVTVAAVTQETGIAEFDELFREHYRLIYRTALAITGKSEDAEDVLQTIFLRLLRREFPPDLKKNPRAYLYRGAVNASLSVLRARRRRLQIHDIDTIQSLYASNDGNPDSNNDTHARLIDALSHLNASAVELLMLRYFHAYSDAEIAKLLGTTRGSVAVRLFRARAQLKKLMKASGENL